MSETLDKGRKTEKNGAFLTKTNKYRVTKRKNECGFFVSYGSGTIAVEH